MPDRFQFHDLFVFDLANNHQGSVEHGLEIIQAVASVAHRNNVRAALKFQYRQLDTFIHPAHRSSTCNKHIPRFLATALSEREFAQLTDHVRQSGLITMATPFDEESVDQLLDHGIDVIKIASCSATDWPLIERIADANKPVIFSTGGLTWKQIDDLVTFFDHRRVHCAIMHCVSLYPTPAHLLHLNRIDQLRSRYPDKVIGFSTHEDPADTAPVQVAVAKGARILERHVGIPMTGCKLNAYSSTPEQLDAWIKAASRARAMCGSHCQDTVNDAELASIQSLTRGIYLRRRVKNQHFIRRSDVYFAMPCTEGQLPAGKWREGMKAKQNLPKDAPLSESTVEVPAQSSYQTLFTAIHSIKAMLNEARIALPPAFETEFSHHYGLERFHEVGATFITIVNRSYCKKLIIQLPGQKHPAHYHKTKEETFVVLHGVLHLEIEGTCRTLYPGDTQLVQQGVWHAFWTDTGVILEEISTRDVRNDSYYEDKAINHTSRHARKTVVNQWGRYQIGQPTVVSAEKAA